MESAMTGDDTLRRCSRAFVVDPNRSHDSHYADPGLGWRRRAAWARAKSKKGDEHEE